MLCTWMTNLIAIVSITLQLQDFPTMKKTEDEQFEVTVDRLLEYSKNVKVSLQHFLHRIETEGESMSWPHVLDSFTSICGQINTLMRYTRENKSLIENRVVLPIMLSPDPDEELAKTTEGRVQLVNHEMVPGYLRTKPDPEIEEFEKNLQIKSSTIESGPAAKQFNAMAKLVDNTVNIIKSNMARADNDSSRQITKSTSNVIETNDIILAINTGKNLKVHTTPHRNVQPGPSESDLRKHEHMVVQQIPQKQNVKAPELKTNIRAGP